jgi:hypothetical protein
MSFKYCRDCFEKLRQTEIIYINDKYIMVPKTLYLCSDCYIKHYIYSRDKIYTT